MVGSRKGRVTGGGWDLANTLVLPPHQHNMDRVSRDSYLRVSKTHTEPDACQPLPPTTQLAAASKPRAVIQLSHVCWVDREGLVGALGALQCKAYSQGWAWKMLMVKKLP